MHSGPLLLLRRLFGGVDGSCRRGVLPDELEVLSDGPGALKALPLPKPALDMSSGWDTFGDDRPRDQPRRSVVGL